MIYIEYLKARNEKHGTTAHALIAIHEDNDSNSSKMEIQLVSLYYVKSINGNEYIRPSDENILNYQTVGLILFHTNKYATFSDQGLTIPENIRDHGIGRYCMSKLVNWGQNIADDYTVNPIELSFRNATTDEARDLRNGFYFSSGFGLNFDADSENRQGYTNSCKMSSLNNFYNHEKISVTAPQEELAQCRQETLNVHKYKNALIAASLATFAIFSLLIYAMEV